MTTSSSSRKLLPTAKTTTVFLGQPLQLGAWLGML